jgi:hypothetical protein
MHSNTVRGGRPESTGQDSRPVRQYLDRHAEPAAALGASLQGRYSRALVIPAYGESDSLDRSIGSIPGDAVAPTLVLVVLNAHVDSPAWVAQANRETRDRLRARYPLASGVGPQFTLHDTPFGALAMLEATLPARQGVGLARKIGHDFALGAWAAGKVRSNLLYCADADVELPPDHFSAPAGPAAAVLAPFRHHAGEGVDEAHACVYDLWLRYLVLGLSWAGSPYAYHAIGSTIAVDAGSYARVRGFPRRVAAEDFHMLGKLAKVGRIVTSSASPMSITARLSDRVPFGTGRSMVEAASRGTDALERFPHPDVFRCLKALLAACDQSLETGTPLVPLLSRRLGEEGVEPENPLAVVIELEIEGALERARAAAADPARRRRAFSQWLDAFRTMKLMHLLRDRGLAPVRSWELRSLAAFLLRQDAPQVADDVAVVREALGISPD